MAETEPKAQGIQQTEAGTTENKPQTTTTEPEAEKEGGSGEAVPEKPPVPQYRSVVLGSFGGSKHLRTESTDQRKPEKNEIEVEVEAW